MSTAQDDFACQLHLLHTTFVENCNGFCLNILLQWYVQSQPDPVNRVAGLHNEAFEMMTCAVMHGLHYANQQA